MRRTVAACAALAMLGATLPGGAAYADGPYEVPKPPEILIGCPELATTDIGRISAYGDRLADTSIRKAYWYATRSVRPDIERGAGVIVRFTTETSQGRPSNVVIMARDAGGNWKGVAARPLMVWRPYDNRLEMAPVEVPTNLQRELNVFVDGGCLAAEPRSSGSKVPLKGGGEAEVCPATAPWVMQIEARGRTFEFIGSCRPWPSGRIMAELVTLEGGRP